MKFLFVANVLRNENTGTAGHIIHLARAIDKKGHTARTFFRDDLFAGIKYNIPLNIIVFLSFPLIAAFKIFYSDFQNDYDFIIISSGDGFLYALLKKMVFFKKKPLVIMRSHGYEYLYKEELEAEKRFNNHSYFTLKERIFLFGFRLIQVRVFSYLCDSIFTLNNNEKVYLEKIYPNKRIFAVPVGIDPIFMSPDTEVSRSRDILFVGGWTRLKGWVYLVKIIDRLNKGKSDLAVSILGTGVNDKYVLAEFSDSTRDRIRVIKFLPKNMLKKEYLSHKVFLFPSLFEGYGNVILEAMAAGMVVVVSKGLGATENIIDGYNGFLVEKRDVDGFVKTVEKILGDEAVMKEIGKNAERSVKHMTWDNIAERVIKNCKEI